MKRASCLIIFLVSLLCSCAPGIQPLLDDYNSMFDMTSESYWEGMEKASPSNMILAPEITVQRNGTVNIAVPTGGEDYQWTMEPSKNTDGSPAGIIPPGFDPMLYANPPTQLIIHIPDTSLTLGTYKITVSATFDGKKYTDTCLLTIRGGENSNG